MAVVVNGGGPEVACCCAVDIKTDGRALSHLASDHTDPACPTDAESVSHFSLHVSILFEPCALFTFCALLSVGWWCLPRPFLMTTFLTVGTV